MIKQAILGCCLLLLCLGALAAPQTLTIDEQTSLFFWPGEEKAAGGLLLAQGKGSHGERLLTAMAKRLSQRGWSVAIAPADLSSEQLAEQLPSYLAKLRQKSSLKVGIVWYGDDYHQLLDYFAKPQSKQVSGLILLSAYEYPQKEVKEPWQLRFPVLDIVGQFDMRTVIAAQSDRQNLLDRNLYTNRTIPGARHDYRYHEHYVCAAIDNWLTQIPVPKTGRVF